MPRYFFDFRDNDRHTRDNEGTDLSGLQEARDEAIAVLPQIAGSSLPDGDPHELVLTVRDEAGQNVFRAKLELTTEWLTTRPE